MLPVPKRVADNTDRPTMTTDEIALRAALNVLCDSIETRRMPRGVTLEPDAIALHERAVRHLEMLLSTSQEESA